MIRRCIRNTVVLLCPLMSACGPEPAPDPGPPSKMQWFLESKGASMKADGDALMVSGDDTRYGYQIGSSGISIQENKSVRLTIDYEIESGRVCIGVLDAPKSRWLQINNDPGPELLFQSGTNPQVFIVMANCNDKESGNDKSAFKMKSVRFAYVGQS